MHIINTYIRLFKCLNRVDYMLKFRKCLLYDALIGGILMLDELKQQVNAILKNMAVSEKTYNYGNKSQKVIDALLDIEENHNTSWAVEMYRRNCKNLGKIALKYRGSKISYRELFEKAFIYAKSLKELGYEKGDVIPVCVSNIPEFVYLFFAISFVGCQINVVGDWFDMDYLISIFNDTKSKNIFVSDDVYEFIKDAIDLSNIENVIMFSLEDSLPMDMNGVKYDPYDVFDNQFYKIVNRVSVFKSLSEKPILDDKMFMKIGENFEGQIVANVSLSDPFAITYTSGTTTPGCPKGCIHSNRSYIVLSRFKESDVSGMPSMRNLTVLAHIPTYTHMELSCAFSDTFYEKCTLALEPFYSKETFIYSLIINEPNFVPASVGFWGHVCKLLNYDKFFENVKMPYLMIPTVTGEACSPGEEKFFNYTSRKHGFGTAKLPFPLAPVTFSIGGGTGENSGIFVTLFKALHEKSISNLVNNNTLGLTPHKFVEIEVLNEDGDYCKIGEPGQLTVNLDSPCNMIGYTDSGLNDKMIMVDKYGNKRFNMGAFAYKSDEFGRIKIKGRKDSKINSSSGIDVPYYVIEDEVMKDTKNVMSCSLVKVVCDDVDYYVCHVEFQPNARLSKEKILTSCARRLNKVIPDDILNILYFRVRNITESFPLAPSGKRNLFPLIDEGISDRCIPLKEYLRLKTYGKKKKLTK